MFLRFRWWWVAALAGLGPARGARAQAPGYVTANPVFAPSDSVLYFAYAFRNQTGLYRFHPHTGAVVEAVRPVPGTVLTLDLRGRQLVAVRTRRTPDGYRNEVLVHTLGDSTWAVLPHVPAQVWDAAATDTPGRLLLVVSAEVGRSSPLVPRRPRNMDVCVRPAADSALRRVAALHAYAIGPKLHLRPSGAALYLRAEFGAGGGGPYRVAGPSGEVRSLLPANLDQLQPDAAGNSAARSFLTRWLSPTPGRPGTYFLHDPSHVYRVDERTGQGTAVSFAQRPERYSGPVRIAGLAAMHRTDGVALLLQFVHHDKQCLRLVDASGELTDWDVYMAHFHSRY